MAYTKIFAVRDRLSRIVAYAVNPDKITLENGERLSDMVDYALNPVKTGDRLFESALNCASPETALEEMQATKKRFGKTGGVLAYHIIQSFAPGEVSPEEAHEIGLAFARRMFEGNFEVVVGTHLDRNHPHNHIVVNSVSHVDGQKYHSSPASYYRQIRGISDALCEEHRLSVIEPKGRGKHYAEWAAEQEGKPTVRGLIRADVDDCIRRAFTFNAFVANLKTMGYGVKCGPNVKFMAIKPRGGERFIRLKSLGDAYTEQAIRERIEAVREGREPDAATPDAKVIHRPLQYRTRPPRPWRKHHKLTGFTALYWKYCYLLRETMHRKLPNKAAFLLRDELKRFDRYQSQFLMLYKNGIETVEDLQGYRQKKEKELAALTAQRKPLYIERKNADAQRQPEISAEISRITLALKKVRSEIRQCERIAQDAARLQSTCEQVDAAAQEYPNMKKNERPQKAREEQ